MSQVSRVYYLQTKKCSDFKRQELVLEGKLNILKQTEQKTEYN